MEFNRNHYFMLGLVILALGVQIKFVKSYVLSEDATKFAAEYLKTPSSPAESKTLPLMMQLSPVPPRKVVTPPNWLGFAVLSAGGVLVMFSLAMQKPSG